MNIREFTSLPLPRRRLCDLRIATIVSGLLILAGGASTSCAATSIMPPATMATPLRDPYVPPEARPAFVPAPLEGAALRAKVESKLKASFDTADVDGTGTITRAQAQAHGLGYIVQHFDSIDRAHSGRVSFDDVRGFMQQRAAQANQQR
jgi:hypothetical protein